MPRFQPPLLVVSQRHHQCDSLASCRNAWPAAPALEPETRRSGFQETKPWYKRCWLTTLILKHWVAAIMIKVASAQHSKLVNHCHSSLRQSSGSGTMISSLHWWLLYLGKWLAERWKTWDPWLELCHWTPNKQKMDCTWSPVDSEATSWGH